MKKVFLYTPRSYHQLCPVSVDEIGYKLVRNDNIFLAGTFTKAVNPKVSFNKISANEYVACYYDSNWWVGLVQNVNCDERMLKEFFYTLQDPRTALLGQRESCLLGTINEYDM